MVLPLALLIIPLALAAFFFLMSRDLKHDPATCLECLSKGRE